MASSCRKWYRQVIIGNPRWLIPLVNQERFGLQLKRVAWTSRSDDRWLVDLTFVKGGTNLNVVTQDSNTKAWKISQFNPYQKMRWRDVVRMVWLLTGSKKWDREEIKSFKVKKRKIRIVGDKLSSLIEKMRAGNG